MKKIINVLALATLTLGLASADTVFTLNYRTRMSAFSRVMGYGSKSADAVKGAAYTSHLFDHTGYNSAKDGFGITVGNDFGGATVRIDPVAGKNEGTDDTENAFQLAEYNGYINIGGLTFGTGLFDGHANEEYFLKGEIEKSNLGDETGAAYALGSIFTNAITLNATDITSFSDKQKVTAYLSYTAKLNEENKVTADLAAIGLGNGTYNDKGDVKAGFAVRLNADLSATAAQFVFKQESIKSNSAKRALALHFMPKISDSLKLTLGGALGFFNGSLTEYNADIRVQVKAGAFSITSLNTISALSHDADTFGNDYGVAATYNQHVGTVYCLGDHKLTYANNTESRRAMWNVIAVRMEASEKMALTFEAGDIVGFKSKGVTFGDCGIEAFLAPGVQFFAGKNCSISTCARFGWSHLMLNKDDHEDVGPEMALLVPVVLRVKL